VDHPFQIVNSAANGPELGVVASLKRLVTLALELFDLRLNGGFVETDDLFLFSIFYFLFLICHLFTSL
jgi:hypothetical protein